MIHESGAKLFHGSSRKTQPAVLEVPGEVCEAGHVVDLLAAGKDLGAGLTRFDVACDVFPEDQAHRRWLQMRREFRAGRCETRVPKTSFREFRSDRAGEGLTAYFGSRASEQFTRSYTKRGPLRIEIEMKPDGRKMRESWTSMLNAFPVDQVWRALAKHIVWPLDWYQKLLEGEVVTLEQERVERCELKELLHHLLEQIGPTLFLLTEAEIPMSLITRPPANPNGLWLEQMRRFASQATAMGYNGARLCAAAENLSKSKGVRSK